MRTRVSCFSVAYMLVHPTLTMAQSDWSRVTALPVGARLILTIPKSVEQSRLRSVDDTQITLDTVRAPREDVWQAIRLHSRATQGALRGMAIGFAIGATGAMIADYKNKKVAIAYHGGGLAMWGGIIGAVWGSGKSRPEVVYYQPALNLPPK